MSPAVSSTPCTREGCDVVRTGVCAEGHDPVSECEYYAGNRSAGDATNFGNDVSQHEMNGAGKTNYVRLPSGDGLTSAEVDEFLRWRPATFVTIVGDRESGKTTLVCAIYDRFLKGPFAGYLFAGSRTLLALETKSHYARVDSGSPQPDTPRTSLSEGLRFFHFAVAPTADAESRYDLMLADRAGETYKQARSKTALVHDLSEVAKADRLVLLLDGARVSNPPERAGALQSVRQSLRVFLDNGAVDETSRVQVVTTKIDLLSPHAEAQDIAAQLAQFRERLRGDFESRLAELSFWDIAARDPRGAFNPAHGLDALLVDWTTSRKISSPSRELATPVSTEFDRLLLRTPRKLWS